MRKRIRFAWQTMSHRVARISAAIGTSATPPVPKLLRRWMSVSAKMRPGFERRGMSAFKGVVASTDHFDSTFQAAADTNGVAITIGRASAHWNVKNKSLS